VQVQDLIENKTIIYSSYRKAARALNIDKQIIIDYFNRNQSKPYKKRYGFYLGRASAPTQVLMEAF
jgi:hypothetical protein